MLKMNSLFLVCKPLLNNRVSNVRTLKYLTEPYIKTVNSFKTKLDNVKLPERFKGTVIEKWTFYWKDLYTDYYAVGKDTVTSVRDRPRKTLFILTCCGFLLYCCKTNPTESCFRDSLLTASNDVMLVSKPLRNPNSDNHLIFIESCYNAGLMRNFSFGIFSVMWINDYDSAVGLYKANCSYLQPQYHTLYNRIVDIGFLNKWWLIETKMKDYDINPEQWPNE